MTEAKLVELVKKIDERTTAGVMKWESTASDFEFQTTLSSFVIRVSRNSLPGDADFLAMVLVDKNGTELESLSDGELGSIFTAAGEYRNNAHTLLQRIFTNAKRQALGVDKAIDDILSELGGEPPP